MDERINQLPKIELHCHLDGSLSRGCVEELLGRKVSDRELMVDDNCKSLAQYLEKFDLPLKCLQTEEGLRKAGYDFMRQMAMDGIIYVEVRLAPIQSVNAQLNCRRVIEAVLEGLERGKKKFHIEYGLIVCAMRNHSDSQNLRMIRTAREFLGEGVCAADLAGDEAAYPMREFIPLFSEVRKLGMPFTIHAGECNSLENIVEAVQCGAARIGHGIALRGHPVDIAVLKECGTGIEMCPVSNLQTKAVQSKDDYPLREFIDRGLLVTLNTDNRTVSNTTIGKEIDFVQENCGITDEEIVEIQKNAVKVAFASDEVKEKLFKRL